jgi:hypothetical protein
MDTNKVDDTNPARVLRDAADYLRRYGWTRNVFFRQGTGEQPEACVLGAMQVVVTGYPIQALSRTGISCNSGLSHQERDTVLDAAHVLCDYIVAYFIVDLDEDIAGDVVDLITTWNDDETRSFRNVLVALDLAADRYDAEHREALS